MTEGLLVSNMVLWVLVIVLALVVLVLGLHWPVMATGLKSISPIWMGVFRVVGAFLVVFTISASTHNVIVPPTARHREAACSNEAASALSRAQLPRIAGENNQRLHYDHSLRHHRFHG